MRSFVLVLAYLACVGHARRVQMKSEPQQDTLDASTALAALLLASEQPDAFAYSAPSPRFNPTSRSAVSQRLNQVGYRGVADVRMDEPSSKATTIGAAAIGGVIGVQFFEADLLGALIWSVIFAYLSTYSSGIGGLIQKAGSFGAKAYDKTLEVNSEYELLPKVKGAADSVFSVADNLNKNYGITDSIDEKIGISEKIDGLKNTVDDVTGSIKGKVDDLSQAAKSS
mmetsp:Transcript_77606/g.147614  ORF Transcript_77606/g.147614 Transcript_77606/m.147614 type:complete len:226 (-) Transcript_77606:196-873(-)